MNVGELKKELAKAKDTDLVVITVKKDKLEDSDWAAYDVHSVDFGWHNVVDLVLDEESPRML